MLGDAFEHVPPDEDTRVFKRERHDFGSLRILQESWSWDGMSGRTLILPLHDTHDYQQEKILEILGKVFPLGEDFTLSHNEDYLFINYGFESS